MANSKALGNLFQQQARNTLLDTTEAQPENRRMNTGKTLASLDRAVPEAPAGGLRAPVFPMP
jgi:hypothetical protein